MSKDIFPVVMPKLGMEMTEGQITKWHFKEGDALNLGAELADIETDKLSIPYEVEFEGNLKSVIAEEGVTYPVGKLLAVIAAEGVTDDQVDEFVSSYKSVEPEEVEVAEAGGGYGSAVPSSSNGAAPAQTGPQASSVSSDAVRTFIEENNLNISPIAARLAIQAGVDLSSVSGTGRLGRISVANVEAAAGGPLGRKANRVNASPVAKRLAKQKGVDLDVIQGTGPNGRILKRDVEGASAGGGLASVVQVGPARYRTEPLSGMRKAIARRLVQSKTEAPHHYLRIELHMAELMSLREGINKRLGDKKVSVNDLLVRAVGLALRDVPEANVQYADDEMRFFNQADVGVAVAVESGLITPIVKGACKKSVLQISGEIAALAEKARSGGLLPADIEGGTITLSNLGMFGIQGFDAVVNPPQGAIIAVGAVEERPANVNGLLDLAPMMHVTMSCDHRAIDGAVGAKYLAAFKDLIENPVSLVI